MLIFFYFDNYIAVAKLDKVKLWDKVLQVGLSKFPEIQIPIKNVVKIYLFIFWFLLKKYFN